ncbi:hypothetical protein RHOSPDRAFT_31152 [Rhodotorula sp. JG-1b]|nr:hypothetical protein RHOSPDRAFT_31152 [Rhodotorula sp. JG-1b]
MATTAAAGLPRAARTPSLRLTQVAIDQLPSFVSKSEVDQQPAHQSEGAIENWRIEVAQELEREKTKRVSVGESVAQAVQDVSELFLRSPFLRSFKVASLILPTGDLPVQFSPATTESWSYPTTPTTVVYSAIVQTAYRADIQNGHFVPRQSPPTRTFDQSDRSESHRSSDLEQEKGPSLAFPLRSGSFGEIRPSQPGLRPPPSGSPPFSNLASGDGLPSGYNLANIPAKAAAILGLNDAVVTSATASR